MQCLRQLADKPTGFPAHAASLMFTIDGLIQTESLNERGLDGRNPFRIGIGYGGNWKPIEAAWNSSTLTAEHLGDLFLRHVVLPDIFGRVPRRDQGWGFPGEKYTITAKPRPAGY